MRTMPGAILRSTAAGALGFIMLLAPMGTSLDVANAQGYGPPPTPGGPPAVTTGTTTAPAQAAPPTQPGPPRPAQAGPGQNPDASAALITLSIDAPVAGATVTNGQRLLVGGWAGVTGGRASSVEVFLDSTSPNASLGTAQVGIARPDVATATGHPEWANSGFNFNWMPHNVSAGAHTLYVVARTSSGGSSTQSVQVTGCGCGSNALGSVTNPVVQRIGTIGWEIDTGGPGTLIQREWDLFFW